MGYPTWSKGLTLDGGNTPGLAISIVAENLEAVTQVSSLVRTLDTPQPFLLFSTDHKLVETFGSAGAAITFPNCPINRKHCQPDRSRRLEACKFNTPCFNKIVS